ncbi:MAG: hypothetical protein EOO09_09210 [Chitinophagaceae bacterium]|nr:MAG: hypothetical protein EOO09_09210 [Chitinophagaceae bacterium]
MTKTETGNDSNCFTCNREIPYSTRYPERLCELCMKVAVNRDGQKLSFSNESLSGGFVSYNESTRVNGKEHTCYVKGYECHADEAYMGGIVLVPTANGKEKKTRKQQWNKKARVIVLLASAILAPLAIGAAYNISRNGYFNEGFTFFDVLMITGSISLFLFCCLAFYRNKLLLGLVVLLYLATGYYTTYRYGYRNEAFPDAVAIISTVSAGLLLNALLFSSGYISKKMNDFQGRKKKGNNLWLLLVIIPLLLLIAGYIVMMVTGEEHAAQLVETAPGATTTAIVKAVREYESGGRYNRNKPHNDALLEYVVDGQTFYRIIDNISARYTKGSRLEIQYVLTDPYLIRVLK